MDLSFETLRNVPSVVARHYRNGNINWAMSSWTVLMHSLAVIALFYIPRCSKHTLLWAFLLWPISGFGITVGVHRLWSHRSYEAHFIVRLGLMLCNSIANQGSIIHWVRDHRVHHKFSETDHDPHNATRGFFFSHMGWLLLKKNPAVVKAGKTLDFSDLYEDPVVLFQKKLDPWFAIYMCLIMPAQVAQTFWGEDFWRAFLVAGALRYVFVLHCTFLVNSAAHLYGDHPYDNRSFTGTENPLVSWFAIGEGWHSWHHKYPFDYAASEFGISSQYNPSKLLIDILAFLGLVWGRKRATGAWSVRKARRTMVDQKNGVREKALR